MKAGQRSDEEQRIFTKNILSIENLETEDFLKKKWDSVPQKGLLSRIYTLIDLEKVEIYRCPNNIAVIVLKDDFDYSVIDASVNSKIERGRPCFLVDDKQICLPFAAKFIEISKAEDKLNYIAIVLALE